LVFPVEDEACCRDDDAKEDIHDSWD
jgi:hypothetical protein